MLAFLRPRLTYANVVASLALFVALGGTSYAAITLSKNSVRSSHIKNGEVKRADLAKGLLTTRPAVPGPAGPAGAAGARGETGPRGATGEKGATGAEGKQGPEGKQGAQGLQGPADGPAGGDLTGNFPNPTIAANAVGAAEVEDFALTNQDVGVLFAEVNGDGTVANSSGGVTVVKMVGSAGNYEVNFGRAVSTCTAVATLGPAGSGSTEGLINVADRAGIPNAVFVDTNANDGTAADKPFRLVVVC